MSCALQTSESVTAVELRYLRGPGWRCDCAARRSAPRLTERYIAKSAIAIALEPEAGIVKCVGGVGVRRARGG